jgi:hypothetical protein
MLKWFYRLSWKKIGSIGGLALALAVLPLLRQVATNPTRTRSEAALIPQPQPISKEFVVPQGPPQIFLVDHFFGKPEDAVLIHGTNLGGFHPQSFVSINGVKIETEDLVSWTSDYIEFKVPKKATSGIVAVSILGQTASWPGIFFVTSDQTEAELRLVGNNNTANLMAQNISGGQDLLVWILVIKGEGQLTITGNQTSATISTQSISLGTIYEVRLNLPSQLTSQSTNQLINLLTITKNDDQLIGIARAEISTANGQLIPIQAHPLYVSF